MFTDYFIDLTRAEIYSRLSREWCKSNAFGGVGIMMTDDAYAVVRI